MKERGRERRRRMEEKSGGVYTLRRALKIGGGGNSALNTVIKRGRGRETRRGGKIYGERG